MKIKKDDFYYLYIAIMAIVFYFRFYNFNNYIVDYIFIGISIIALVIFMIYWIMSDFTVKDRSIHGIIVAFCLLLYCLSGKQYEYLIFSALAIIGMKHKSMKKIMKIFFISYFVCIMLHIYFLLLGIFEDNIYTKISSGRKIQIHSLGFATGNTFFAILFILYSSYIYYKYKEINYLHLIFMELICISFYFIFYSRTGLVVITILILGTFIKKYINLHRYLAKIIGCLEIVVIPLLFVVTYIFSTLLYGSNIQILLDKIISNRLVISHDYFLVYPLKLFQESFNYIGDLPLDNMYSFILCAFGVVATVVMCISYVYLMIKLFKGKKYFEMYMITLFALYSYSEKMFINAFRNPSIFFLAVILYKEYNILDLEEKN